MNAYLDASVLLPILIEEPASAGVDAFMLRADRQLLVSEFAVAEVAAALSRLVRMGRLDMSDAELRLSDFDTWCAAMTTPVEVMAVDVKLSILTFDALISGSAPQMPCTSRSHVALMPAL